MLWIVIFRAWLPNNLKSFDLTLIKINFWWHFYIVTECLHEKVRERTAKVSSIQISGCLNAASIFRFPFLYHVNFFTFWAIVFNSTAAEFLTKSNRNTLLIVAKGSGTVSKLTFKILSQHF